MATWPETLPAPLVEGYEVAPANQAIRTEMESGAPRQRRVTAARMDIVSAAWSLSGEQFTDFRDFFDDATGGADGGAAWFTVDLDYDGSGPTSVEARFVGAPMAARAGLRWQITGQLELRY